MKQSGKKKRPSNRVEPVDLAPNCWAYMTRSGKHFDIVARNCHGHFTVIVRVPRQALADMLRRQP